MIYIIGMLLGFLDIAPMDPADYAQVEEVADMLPVFIIIGVVLLAVVAAAAVIIVKKMKKRA
ncbi:MAG: hypothetical protein K6G81_06610 [Lachnospiraceae bacterium]|nr:hypothetical protein [Lachnospiraceae bacterium]